MATGPHRFGALHFEDLRISQSLGRATGPSRPSITQSYRTWQAGSWPLSIAHCHLVMRTTTCALRIATNMEQDYGALDSAMNHLHAHWELDLSSGFTLECHITLGMKMTTCWPHTDFVPFHNVIMNSLIRTFPPTPLGASVELEVTLGFSYSCSSYGWFFALPM